MDTLTNMIIKSKTMRSNIAEISPTPATKLLLIRLFDLFKQEHTEKIVMSQSCISESISCEYKTVGKLLRQLVDCGFLFAKKEKLIVNTWVYYGINEITFISNNGEEFISKRRCSSEYVKEAPDVKEIKHGEYYVYVCKFNEIPVYIGKGKNERLNHCLSGSSSNSELNMAVFKHGAEKFSVTKVYENLSEDDALKKEKDLITSFIKLGFNLFNKNI